MYSQCRSVQINTTLSTPTLKYYPSVRNITEVEIYLRDVKGTLAAVLVPRSISFSPVNALPFEGIFFQAREDKDDSSDNIVNKISTSAVKINS